jgi:uncharacterized protein YjbI with pentapeptide repeats
MADPEHLAMLKQGSQAWNEWRRRQGEKLVPDLTEADLSRADLGGSLLSGSLLSHADLSNANLSWSHLVRADLARANLANAKLVAARLEEANLSGADLTGADLYGALIGGTNFTRAVLKGVAGLDHGWYFEPSILDHETLVRSGPLPIEFLRGCGIPEHFINALPDMLHRPVRYYNCFISYSAKDQDFATHLFDDLRKNGVECWFSPHDVQSGKKLYDQLSDAIKASERLLLILSDTSLASEWVKTEIAEAREKEVRENRQVLFPISIVPFEKIRAWKCFDADRGKDSAREIREYFIPDFSNWKDPDAYHSAFQRLLRDFKADAENKSEREV